MLIKPNYCLTSPIFLSLYHWYQSHDLRPWQKGQGLSGLGACYEEVVPIYFHSTIYYQNLSKKLEIVFGAKTFNN